MRRRFDAAGAVLDTHGEYPDLVRSVARETATPLLDLHRESGRVLAEYGPARSVELFLQLKPGEDPNYPAGITDNTHFSPKGAAVMADRVAAAIRGVDLPIAKELK
jgi:lysophospholipase L1-like esterase